LKGDDYGVNILNNNNPLDEFRKRNGQELIINLNNKIKACAKCDNNFCHKCYYGNANAKVLIINDNATNDKEIIEYYNDLLEMSDLDINDVLQVYAVSCVTTRKDKENIIQRLPSKKECNNCKEYLNEVIDIIKPKVIISLGATALNQFMPGSNLLDYINTKQVFNGIPTLINYSIKDLFNLCSYKTEDEIDEISSSILATFNEAAQYIKLTRSDD
jgi:uracil-DNA glycosylase family 4